MAFEGLHACSTTAAKDKPTLIKAGSSLGLFHSARSSPTDLEASRHLDIAAGGSAIPMGICKLLHTTTTLEQGPYFRHEAAR